MFSSSRKARQACLIINETGTFSSRRKARQAYIEIKNEQ